MTSMDRRLIICAILSAVVVGCGAIWLSGPNTQQKIAATGFALVFVAAVFALLSTVFAGEPDWTTIARSPAKSVVYTVLSILIVGTALQVVSFLFGPFGQTTPGVTRVRQLTTPSHLGAAEAVLGGVISGFFALAGAWLGVRGAFQVQVQSDVSRRVGAGRTVLVEMRDNCEILLSASGAILEVGPYRPVQNFSTTAWTRHSPLLANLLEWEELDSVSIAYSSGASILNFVASIPEGRDVRQFGLREQFASIAEKHVAPMSMLARKVLSGVARERFDKQIEDLKDRIAQQIHVAQVMHRNVNA